jgi:chromosome segregation ATPase
MRKMTAFILVALLLASAAASAGCDTRKGERAELLKQVSAVESELSRLSQQRSEVSRAVEMLPAEIKQASEGLQQHVQRRTKLQDDLGLYIMDHKLATVAVMATVGGVAGVVSDNVDEDTKGTLGLVGLIGALYCAANGEECADVATRVLYFGSQIEAANKNISDLTASLSAKKTLLQKREQELAALAKTIDGKTGERDSLKQKHDSLVCRLCF